LADRASRYASSDRAKNKSGSAIIIAHVHRTPRGKIRLSSVGVRIGGDQEKDVLRLPLTDPRYVFENDYKVRKAAHALVKASGRFSKFHDSSARVFYDSGKD
jgi:hypothetical protein